VQFRLEASGARHVSLAGTFTNWKPVYELHETAPGLWAITLPLPAGVHDYSFVVDGMRWIPDPYAPQIQDGFGGTSSRLALMTPAMRES
jgi:1,4-alpha-glucan branching enzyme